MNVEYVYSEYLLSNGISTDTRSLKDNQIFVALKGENYDANDFIEEALNKNPRLVISTRKSSDDRVVTVDNTLEALTELARYHRSKLEIPVIAITGSNGKTTTKELVNAVLSKKYSCLATKGNYNNHIGVPLTILSISSGHEIAIVEMGANHIGEIALLCEIAKPTHGIITNIGKAHLEGFGSFEGVLKAKGELYSYLEKNQGTIFVNATSKVLNSILPQDTDRVLYGEDYMIYSSFPTLIMDCKGERVTTQLTGGYNATNIACALILGEFFEVNRQKRLEAIAEYKPVNKRSQLLQYGTNVIVIDCYNANPMSMEESIENVLKAEYKHKVFILGDMLEMGEYSIEEHQLIVDKLNSYKGIKVFLVGKEFSKTETAYPVYEHVEELRKEVSIDSYSESIILLKGSRGIGLEKYLDGVK